MAKSIEAVFERGVFKPLEPVGLQEGQKVTISVESEPVPWSQAEEQLNRWKQVYSGLSEDDIAEIERVATSRTAFFSQRGA